MDLFGLQIYLFSACTKLFPRGLLSIILFTCPFFSGDAGMSTKFVVHNVFHLSENRKNSQFHPFSTTTNFRFKSLRTVFIIIHFIFLEAPIFFLAFNVSATQAETISRRKSLSKQDTYIQCTRCSFCVL